MSRFLKESAKRQTLNELYPDGYCECARPDKIILAFLQNHGIIKKAFGGLAQLVRASASHAEGQRFESAALHHHGQPSLMTLRQTQCHQGFPGFFSSEIFLFFH